MMGALFQNSFTIAPKDLSKSRHRWRRLSCNKKSSGTYYCQSNGNMTKTDAFASVLSERSSVLINHGSGGGGAVMDASTKGSSLLISSNGKSTADELAMKDLVPYGGGGGSSSTCLGQVEDQGIGIVRFLGGKGFFVTGATGFLAKVLIEKILRTAPDVGRIYVLIKAKNKDAALQRLKNEIINAEIFKCLRRIHGKSYESFMLSKLVPVVGDVCEYNLGLDDDMVDMVSEDVDIIVNSAANTTFHERYDVAIDINTRGPGRMMAFAKRCKKLKLFLQVSTAYVNGQRQGRIMEKPFKIGDSIATENLLPDNNQPRRRPILDVEAEMNLVSSLLTKTGASSEDHKLAQKLKEVGLERARKYGWQDTYVFTKAMGEMLLGNNMRSDVPVVILRPSVVESTYKDPFPGWIEGNRMMDPVVSYYGKGQLSGFPVNPNGVIDVVPADMVVSATLAAIAKHGIAGKPGISVYQVASSVVNPLFYRNLAELMYEHFRRLPYMNSDGRPVQVDAFKFYSSMEEFSSQLWVEKIRQINSSSSSSPSPSTTTSIQTLEGITKSRKLENIYRKCTEQAKYLASVYQPYSFYGGRFDNSSTQSLMNSMSDEEKTMFHFDVGNIDWKDYICNVHIPGLRRHVMKKGKQLSN